MAIDQPAPADRAGAGQVAAHAQRVTHTYLVNYPEHEPRGSDPHLHDFEEYKKRRKADAKWHCDFAQEYRAGDQSECDLTKPLECHHKHIEFALRNGVDITLLEPHFPGISKQDIGAWIDSDPNLELLCVFHHRGRGGKHTAAYADYESAQWFRHLIS